MTPQDPRKADSPPRKGVERVEKAVSEILRPARRFARTDGRFDLPVVTGRTPQEVARRLA